MDVSILYRGALGALTAPQFVSPLLISAVALAKLARLGDGTRVVHFLQEPVDAAAHRLQGVRVVLSSLGLRDFQEVFR